MGYKNDILIPSEHRDSASFNSNMQKDSTNSKSNLIEIPSISLPTGGGAIKGIEEKFQVNAVNGTSSFSIPLPLTTASRLVPSISLSYNSGGGNSPFGLGWQLGIPSITRKTEKNLPTYQDKIDADTFVFSGAEDLIRVLTKDGTTWKRTTMQKSDEGINYTVAAYRPRIEGSFARIERWENNATGISHWRTVTKDNIHAYYGLTDESRITSPHDSSKTKIAEWLLCKTHDDKGNIFIYRYKQEDFANIPSKLYEQYRKNNCTQVYLKTIFYGNKKPYYLGDALPKEDGTGYMFNVVFDYGEHDAAENIPKDINKEKMVWACRKDPFSTYRSGFEIRTYRRCSRVLVFHCFDELPHSPYLTKSLQLFYDDNTKHVSTKQKIGGFSFLTRARQNGHLWNSDTNTYSTKFLPETNILYQQHEWNINIKTVTENSIANLPTGLADKKYLWIDLFNEGISGILTEQSGAWFYKKNLGNALFSNAVPVANTPSFRGLGKNLFIQDLEGNGIKYLAQLDDEPKGFFKFSEQDVWQPMQTFKSLPTIGSANMRILDLNADGKADILISEENGFEWYEGLGEGGFKIAQKTFKEVDEEKGPAIVFEDREQCIFLADMSGDGLTDIVRIRNHEICYWPNLGYGQFGSKVAMDNAPVFDRPDTFNPALLRLADIDGSGTTDIIYLGKNNFSVWMNLNGNEWAAAPKIINPFPAVHNLADVSVLDFLGSGTACIVYSSAIGNQPLQYIDLMGSKKPHVFIGYHNNCGKEVSIEYKPSTYYYLKDKREGKKWITKLPFVVHCIAKVKVEDKIRNTIFTSTYNYSHGYFDFAEREFRGFARVEQLDTEDFEHFKLNDAKNVVAEQHHQPPTRSVSWFHTGAFLQGKNILHQCQQEYFNNTHFAEYNLPEPILPQGLSIEEAKEALRACKGLPLRSEIYSDDKSSQSHLPYTAVQSAFEIRLVQPKGENKFASFLVVPSQSINYGYDRNPADPHITQSFVLETDELGNATQSAAVIYPRVARPANITDKVWQEQNKLHISYAEVLLTNDIDTNSIYRLRTVYESRSFEINGINQPVNFFFEKEGIKAKISSAITILFEEEFTVGIQKRLLAQHRSYFMNDAFNGARPLGQLSPLGIGFKSYSLAFTKNLVLKYYGTKVTPQMLIDAKYVHSENDEHWWVSSGDYIYPNNPSSNFYTPIGTKDLYGNTSFIQLDQYHLLGVSTTDAIGNKATVVNDYRLLSPVLLTDCNLNRATVQTDELGMVIKTAVMGKVGSTDGDTLADPTTKLEYSLFNWQLNGKPNFVHTLAREKHGTVNTRWQESYAYSNGGGSVIMTKSQANAGKAKHWNAATKMVEEVDANPRWIGNGRTIINNKGKTIKQFEPYFSTTFDYESEDALVETGISPILYYDAIGRNIKTEMPNGTFTKVEFDSWHFKSYDVNDTVIDSQWYADRGSPNPLAAEPVDAQQRAAWLAAKHYNTPSTVHTDSLGKSFYAITDYGKGKTSVVFSETDSAGRFTKMYDQLGRLISEGYVNMLGQTIYGKTAERGENWAFGDAMGRMVKVWDNNIGEYRTTYDTLHRPISAYVKQGASEILFSHIVYGDIFPNAELQNLRGVPYQVYDQAGVMTVKKIDFKGSVTEIERVLTKEYKLDINWNVLENLNNIAAINTAALPLLETETFSSTTTLDALGRPITVILPDKSEVQPIYDEGNGLAALNIKIRGKGGFVNFLESQEYDAKGQRQFAKFGNGIFTKYFYDPKTFRLANLVTTQNVAAGINTALQNLNYTFDPVGNITQIRDDAQQTHYFNNAVVYPESKFEYDALYQLVSATGREHSSLNTQRTDTDLPLINQLPHQNNATAVRVYRESYEYDLLGNIKLLQHKASGANWNQRYQYQFDVNANNLTNRLNATNIPTDADGVFSNNYTYDLHGNITTMPHLSQMVWNFMDQLKEVNLGGGGKAYYTYAIGGNRIRKIIERNGGKRLERIYLGAIEIYRERQGNNATRLERYTISVADNTGKIAQIDTKTIDTNNSDTINQLNENNIRYQYGNHLGSASLETDETGQVISYEEYHPFGTSAYRVAKPSKDISLKRYRFSSKERDEETGLYYFGARYYAAWLGRWTSSDPAGFVSGFNLYKYCSNNPVIRIDPNGMQDHTGCTFGIPRTDGTFILGWDCRDRLTIPPPEEPRHAAPSPPVTPPPRRRSARRAAPPPPAAASVPLAPAEPPPAAAAPPPPTGAGGPNPAEILRQGVLGANQPQLSTGGTAPGDLHLYSGPSGDSAARAAASTGNAYYLRDTPHYTSADAAEQALKRSLGRPLDYMTEARPIWDPTSRNLAKEAALGGKGIESHGLDTYLHETGRAPGGTTQAMVEIPTAIRYGGATAFLGVLSGGLTIWSASHYNNPVMRGVGYVSGGGEILGAAQYARGLYQLSQWAPGSAASMSSGALGMRVFGGVGLIIMSSYNLADHIQTGNYGLTVSDTAGYVGGFAILAGSTQVAVGAGGIAFANVAGDWAERQVTPQYGRGAGIAAGTAAGLGVGAVVVGVLAAFGLVTNPVGWAILAGCGIAGLIGAIW
jgi:RHS repeat-associated protein